MAIAMGIAMLYPGGGRTGPGNVDPARIEAESASISMTRIKQARQILRHSTPLAAD
jgi:hypothetical protein